MEMNNLGTQTTLNKTDLMVSDGKTAPNSKGENVAITVTDWIIPGRFYPSSVKERNKQIMDNTKTTLEMYTSDKTVFSKVDKAIAAGKETTINTVDGKKVAINGEGGMIIIRLY